MLWRTLNVSLSRYWDPSLRVNKLWPLWFSSTGKGVVISPNSSEIIPMEWNFTSGSIWPNHIGHKVKQRTKYCWNKGCPVHERANTNHLNRFPSNQAASLSTSLSCHHPAKQKSTFKWKLGGQRYMVNKMNRLIHRIASQCQTEKWNPIVILLSTWMHKTWFQRLNSSLNRKSSQPCMSLSKQSRNLLKVSAISQTNPPETFGSLQFL